MIRHRLLVAAIVLCAFAPDACATLSFPSVVERIAGARVDIAPARVPFSDEHASLRIELADAELYGIAGLRSSGVRATATHGPVIFGGSLVNVASPVGTHAKVLLEAGCRLGEAWQGAVRAGGERLALDDHEHATWRVAGIASRVDVGRVAVIADLEAVEGTSSFDTSLALAAGVRADAVHLIGTVQVDGDRFVGAGIAVVARLHSSLALLAGYDDGAESLRAGVVIRWRRIEIASGVFQHPVLGMSQGVSVACLR